MLSKLKANIALTAILLSVFQVFSQAQASTVTVINDSWTDWNNEAQYYSGKGDEIGNPKLDALRITVGDNNILEKVELLWRPDSGTYTRIKFDSLFINSYDLTTTNSDWDDWDYLIHDGGTSNLSSVDGNVPGNGLWEVKSGYSYTTAKNSGGIRHGNPDGIDADYLKNKKNMYIKHGRHKEPLIHWDADNGILTYELASFGIMSESRFYIAYAPYCANDLIGGSVSAVPVPATVWLFASGLIGLVAFRRRANKPI